MIRQSSASVLALPNPHWAHRSPPRRATHWSTPRNKPHPNIKSNRHRGHCTFRAPYQHSLASYCRLPRTLNHTTPVKTTACSKKKAPRAACRVAARRVSPRRPSKPDKTQSRPGRGYAAPSGHSGCRRSDHVAADRAPHVRMPESSGGGSADGGGEGRTPVLLMETMCVAACLCPPAPRMGGCVCGALPRRRRRPSCVAACVCATLFLRWRWGSRAQPIVRATARVNSLVNSCCHLPGCAAQDIDRVAALRRTPVLRGAHPRTGAGCCCRQRRRG